MVVDVEVPEYPRLNSDSGVDVSRERGGGTWGVGVVAEPPPASQQPRSRQYYLPPREGDNLIDARATLGLVVGITPSSRKRRNVRCAV
ncbi:unnamed protein product [Lasius platythorax]|uniref:Uncharacterized protein n=1 Tax=Lasius platythorax TaxID=488582 RepID=A0AAV2NSR1_9HYME